jgi:hypothetical protein
VINLNKMKESLIGGISFLQNVNLRPILRYFALEEEGLGGVPGLDVADAEGGPRGLGLGELHDAVAVGAAVKKFEPGVFLFDRQCQTVHHGIDEGTGQRLGNAQDLLNDLIDCFVRDRVGGRNGAGGWSLG